LWVESVGLSAFPQRQQFFGRVGHVGIGNVFGLEVKGIGQPATRLLCAEDTALQEASGFGLGNEAGRADVPVAKPDPAVAGEVKGADHAVAVERMLDRLAAAFKQSGPVAVERAAEVSRQVAFDVVNPVVAFFSQ
jgi:hypothetical protein